MPPKGCPRPAHMRHKPLAKIAPKPPSMSRAGVFLSSSSDDNDISPPTSLDTNSPTQPPSEAVELSTSVAPGWAHAGVRVPTMNSYAPAPSVAAPATFVNGNPPSYLSLTSLEGDAASAMVNSMLLNRWLEYDQRVVYEPVDMQASYNMNGAVNETQQGSNEPPMMSTSSSHQVPAASYSSQHMMSWQLETNGYDSAYTQSHPNYTPLALNSAYSQPYAVDFFGFTPPATIQCQAGAWDTGLSGNMGGASVSCSQQTSSSSGNMREAPVSFTFTQQTPSSTAMPVNDQVVGNDWGGRYNGTGMPGPSNDHLPSAPPLRHSQVLQQSPAKAGSEPSASLAHEHPRKCRCVTLQYSVPAT